MAKTPPEDIVELPPDSLRPHPLLIDFFAELADGEIEELATLMARNGQEAPVEVLPDLTTIICGLGRVEAAKRLGWPTVRCQVQRNLAAAGARAVEDRLIAANLDRRHLSESDRDRANKLLKRRAQGGQGQLPGSDEQTS
jgi:ParB-like chromosome segregation protein Spo0J